MSSGFRIRRGVVVVVDLAAGPIDALDAELIAGLALRDHRDVVVPAVVNDILLVGRRVDVDGDEGLAGGPGLSDGGITGLAVSGNEAAARYAAAGFRDVWDDGSTHCIEVG